MERLSGMDASFLYMETPDMHMHVVGTLLLDPATMAGDSSSKASSRC
jgi:diacylglycerol O-acyltransferase